MGINELGEGVRDEGGGEARNGGVNEPGCGGGAEEWGRREPDVVYWGMRSWVETKVRRGGHTVGSAAGGYRGSKREK